MAKSKKVGIDGAEISILWKKDDDYIPLTDITRSQL